VSTGGAGLQCKLVQDSLKKCDTLHLWASTKRLIEGAEHINMRKEHISGAKVEFCIELAQEFKNYGQNGEGFFTMAESQRIIKAALDGVRCHMMMSTPGYTEIMLHKNRGISKLCRYYMKIIKNADLWQIHFIYGSLEQWMSFWMNEKWMNVWTKK